MAPDPYRELPWAVHDIDVMRERAWTYTVAWEEGTDVSDRVWQGQVRDVREGTLLAEMAVDDTDAATGTIVLSLTADDTTGLPGYAVWELCYRIGAGDLVPFMTGAVTVTGWVVAP